MPIDKSDIVQTTGQTRTYKYSHAEEIIVRGKIWIRHIWVRQDPSWHWESQHDENRLMDFEPTDRIAPERSQQLRPKPKKKKSLSDFIRPFGEDA